MLFSFLLGFCHSEGGNVHPWCWDIFILIYSVYLHSQHWKAVPVCGGSSFPPFGMKLSLSPYQQKIAGESHFARWKNPPSPPTPPDNTENTKKDFFNVTKELKIARIFEKYLTFSLKRKLINASNTFYTCIYCFNFLLVLSIRFSYVFMKLPSYL